MSKESLNKELVFLMLKFLDEEGKFKETIHKLEQESGIFFSMGYFKEKVEAGEWDEVEIYLSGFTKLDDNVFSVKIFFKIRKLKYEEAIIRDDMKKAMEIFWKDLKVFWECNAQTYQELTNLITDTDLRKKYTNGFNSAREELFMELQPLIGNNPVFMKKLNFPTVETPRLQTLVEQWWQNHYRTNLRTNPETGTLLGDHLSPNEGVVDNRSSHLEQLPQRLNNEVLDDLLPLKVAWSNDEISSITSMDFHPIFHTLLLVGYANGQVTSWEVAVKEMLHSIPLRVWNLQSYKPEVQSSFANGVPVPISRVLWNLKGDKIGIAFKKHLVQIYDVDPDFQLNLEIVVHAGEVNDLAFCMLYKTQCIVTCGGDNDIRVWNIDGGEMHGVKTHTFNGQKGAVYSIVYQRKQNLDYFLSVGITGKIKAWIYYIKRDFLLINSYAPERGRNAMLFSADGRRLFCCGRNINGDTFLLELEESDGSEKRRYDGLRMKSKMGVVQFDTTKNRFLVAGEDNEIKFWDMDDQNIIARTDAGGGLSSLPYVKFNKAGNLLAVSKEGYGFKILANNECFRSPQQLPALGLETKS